LLLIVLPFAFIRFLYAPWLDAQMRMGAAREVRVGTEGHVIICRWDELGKGLAERLTQLGVTVFVIEPDPVKANDMRRDGIPVVCGDLDSRAFYEDLRVKDAAMVVANLADPVNTNVALTIREESHDVRIVTLADDLDSVDILEFSGASEVLALKQRLGEHLASRVSVGTARPYIVGRFHELCVAEFPVHGTPFAGKTLRESHLRELTGLNIVSLWERGRTYPAKADSVMGDYSVAVVVGHEYEVVGLEAMLSIYQANENPVVVVGGGKVGLAVTRALKERDITVHIVERDRGLEPTLESVADRVFCGDAAAIDVVTAAGVRQAPAVVLTTNDDAINVFLAVYCRRLNPEARIISRITHERNMEAIHRAGADFVLGFTELGNKSLVASYQRREKVIVVVGLDLFILDVPEILVGKSVKEAGIAAHCGLNIAAIQRIDGETETPNASTEFKPGDRLIVLGNIDQRREFECAYNDAPRHSKSSKRSSLAQKSLG
jgi:Trk K+ transport system NAD-binding subunit